MIDENEYSEMHESYIATVKTTISFIILFDDKSTMRKTPFRSPIASSPYKFKCQCVAAKERYQQQIHAPD